MGKTTARCCAIIIENEKVLCVYGGSPAHHKQPFWLFPGGGVESGESCEECAEREVGEETGLHVKVEKLVYIQDLELNGERGFGFFFLAKLVGGKLTSQVTDGGKVQKAEWIDISTFKDLYFLPHEIRDRLYDDYKKGFSDGVQLIRTFPVD